MSSTISTNDDLTLTSPEDIKAWLDKHNVKNYSLEKVSTPLFSPEQEGPVSNWVVNVEGHVILANLNLRCLPVRFGHIKGSFDISNSFIKTLKNCPHTIDVNFICDSNQIKSLAYGPSYVGGDYMCEQNLLTSLHGIPQIIKGDFVCHDNDLVSLEGGPSEVGGLCNVGQNKLTSLKGAPKKVGRGFNVSDNKLLSLEHGPETVGSFYYAKRNELTTLDYLPIEVKGTFSITDNPNLIQYEFETNFKQFLFWREENLVKKDKAKLEKSLSNVSLKVIEKKPNFKV